MIAENARLLAAAIDAVRGRRPETIHAGFLSRFHGSGDMTSALGYAAERAAATCGFFGGFGYPRDFGT